MYSCIAPLILKVSRLTVISHRGFSEKLSDTETAVFGGRGFGFNQNFNVLYSNS